MKIVAHIKENRVQLLQDHLLETSTMANNFADAFDEGRFAKVVAYFHDIGKSSKKFQERIRGRDIQVDHSTAGAQLLYKINKNILGLIAAYCISGHHGGLPNGGSRSHPQSGELFARLKKVVDNFAHDGSNTELGILEEPNLVIKNGFQASFYTRMIFSCLVDADWLDTEKFMLGKQPRGGFLKINELWQRLHKKLEDFSHPKTNLNKLRSEILSDCLLAANQDSGVFTLTAPTGSGKTISSMAFSLKHAVENSKRRIIYIIPYNTIIEQNAKVFEDIFGKENVIQHHSGIIYANDENSPEYSKLLATENWDAPIIVTSNVRFFESLYANSPSRCRKLHNIANSVLVFDEAQMIPLPYLIPCIEAIKELVTNYRCTAVLATATQSRVEEYLRPLNTKEIVSRPNDMYNFFKRVNYKSFNDRLSNEELANKLSQHKQALCIVNTRRQAQALAKLIDGSYHLSTTMYPLHRMKILNNIVKQLKAGEPCIVISTSLIEAGVDIDFPVVYREKAGLDSIVQAAGRCNRENNNSSHESFVYIFESKSIPPKIIARNIGAYEHVRREAEEIASLEAIEQYFKQLRYIIGEEGLDQNLVLEKFNNGALDGFSLPFKEVANSFRLIEENTKTIYVLISAPDLANYLRNEKYDRRIFRTLQQYAVTVHRNDYEKFSFAIEHLDDEILLLTNEDFYDKNIGISLTIEGGVGLFY